MKGMPGGIGQLMKQANQMQIRMKKAQEEIQKMEFEGSAGGGAVKIKITGDYKVTSLHISPDAAGDVEMLQDMITLATNDALKLAKETSAKEMEKVTGGMNIPGLF